MKVIGLTGGTGSGKSVVSRRLAAEGLAIIDADRISHEIIEQGKPAYREILGYFGSGILDENGDIVRRQLGEIVFRDAEKLAFLNQCTHKYIIAEMKRQIENIQESGKAKAAVLDAPLLLEAGLDSICDEVWVVFADSETRMNRIIERDGVSAETAQARIASQKSWEEYQEAADKIIDNSRDIAFVEEQISQLVKNIEQDAE
ncbi:MAG: dephospho-CoA kinase [Anaerotignum sp.]|jgi:dephospho-CoA kinase|nr:dephospho-CoA kinase [Anaerotignum sp.]MCI8867436.1 dephospho-CoA kinase [Anaerotignum sp.]